MRNKFVDKKRPVSTSELLPSERQFTQAMQNLGFGRFEFLRIELGELKLDPWPTTVRNVKFGTRESGSSEVKPAEFELKKQAADLFEYVRGLHAGQIRTLEVRHGLPFSMEIAEASDEEQTC